LASLSRDASASRETNSDERRIVRLIVGAASDEPEDVHEMKARASASRDATGWVRERGMRTRGEAEGRRAAAIGGRGCPPTMSLATLLIACCCWLSLIGQCAGQKPINLGGSKKRDVYIAGFFPYGNHVPEGHIGRGVMPAVKLAVEHINEHPTILRDYRLHMWWNDTEVSEEEARERFS